MAGNTFGDLFRVTTFGESHGKAIGLIIDGCPAGVNIDEDFIQSELDRRKPGQSAIVTQRKESDLIHIQSGVFEGKTTGTPISMVIYNGDAKSKDYSHIQDKYRPSHADYTYDAKYGHRDYRGGGRSSARETACRVAAGAIAKLILQSFGVNITAFVSQVGSIQLPYPSASVDFGVIEKNPVRCANEEIAIEMENLIKAVKKEGDTIGGVVTCVIENCPIGLGEPVFDRLHADLGKAMLSINACKGFEYGSGFSAVEMRGSMHNDAFYNENGKIKTKTNFSGGIQGGISNGMPIYFRSAFKPVATIIPPQQSINNKGEDVVVSGKGRHDPCVVPRAVPIVEAMAALVLIDHWLKQKALV